MTKRTTCFLLMTFLAAACQKSTQTSEAASKQTKAFFSSEGEAISKVSAALADKGSDEQLVTLDNITYVHTPAKAYAFVSYKSHRGTGNAVVTRTYGGNEEMVQESVTTCASNTCECMVRAVIDSKGEISLSCTCSSCLMVTVP